MFVSTKLELSDILRASGRRFLYVDVMRGMMIALVVIAHCFGQSGINPNSWLWVLNPTGWATKVFVMLTGYSAIVILGASNPAMSARIYRRAWEVGLIAWVSNALSAMWTHKSIAAFFPALLFKSPWSISQYLIPTTIVLFVAPILARVASRMKPARFVILILSASLLIDGIAAAKWISADTAIGFLLYGNDIITLSIAHYTMAALCALALAIYFSHLGKMDQVLKLQSQWRLAVVLGLVVLVVDTLFDRAMGELDDYINPIVAWSRFVVFMHLSLIITRNLNVKTLKFIVSILEPIGKSALLIFIIHRPIVHLMGASMGRVALPESAKLAGMVLFVFVIIHFFLQIRRNIAPLNRTLKAVGL